MVLQSTATTRRPGRLSLFGPMACLMDGTQVSAFRSYLRIKLSCPFCHRHFPIRSFAFTPPGLAQCEEETQYTAQGTSSLPSFLSCFCFRWSSVFDSNASLWIPGSTPPWCQVPSAWRARPPAILPIVSHGVLGKITSWCRAGLEIIAIGRAAKRMITD